MHRAPLSAFAGLSLLLLAGCSGMDPGGVVPSNTAAAGEVPITDSVPAGGKVISDLNIELCQATASDPAKTADDALRALKLTAKAKGAAGVANVTSSVVTTPTAKCFTMAQAMGIAYTQG